MSTPVYPPLPDDAPWWAELYIEDLPQDAVLDGEIPYLCKYCRCGYHVARVAGPVDWGDYWHPETCRVRRPLAALAQAVAEAVAAEGDASK